MFNNVLVTGFNFIKVFVIWFNFNEDVVGSGIGGIIIIACKTKNQSKILLTGLMNWSKPYKGKKCLSLGMLEKSQIC